MFLKDRLTIYIKPTEQCNLSCVHCYNKHKDNTSVIDIERLRKFVGSMADYLYKNKKFPELDIVFHGGEPSLVKVEMLEEIYKIIASRFAHTRTKFSIQTNLTRLSTELIEFVKNRLGGDIGTSYSPFLRFVGQPETESLWYHNLEVCRQNNLKVYVVISLSKKYIESTDPSELIDILRSNEISGFHFEPITKNGSASENWSEIAADPKAYTEWKADFAKKFIESGAYKEVQESEIVRKAKTFLDGQFVGCGCRDCMLTVMTINADGTIGICPNVSKDAVICNLDDPFERFIESSARSAYITSERKRRHECLNCEYFQQCNGGCMQSPECYEGVEFFKVLENSMKTNKEFYKFISEYERNSAYCAGKETNE